MKNNWIFCALYLKMREPTLNGKLATFLKPILSKFFGTRQWHNASACPSGQAEAKRKKICAGSQNDAK